MGFSILSIGVSGLGAAQAGLQTTSHNISNASTPGYSRQQIVQSTNLPQFTGSGFLGQGTNVENVQRVYSQFLNNQVLGVQTQSSQLTTYSNEISQIDNLLADPTAGLSPVLQSFFNGVQALATDPSQIPSRQSMLSSGQALVANLQTLNGQLADIRQGVNSQITSTLTNINSYATQIADLNQQIIVAQAAGQGHPANDLLDQRDQLLNQLNTQVAVTTTTESDGSVDVYVGNGQPLVVGSTAFSLVGTANEYDPTQVDIGYKGSTGTISLQDSLLTGGALGGLLSFRTDTLDPAQNALGRVATGLALTFNAQHQLGQDLTGAMGGDFFTAGTPTVSSSSNNTGTGSASAQIINSDYRVTYSGGTYNIVRLSDNTALGSFATLPQTVDGVTISLGSGTPAAGDVFVVKPGNPSGQRVIAASDNTGSAVLDSTESNIAALTTSDYQLNYDGTNYTVTRLSDNTNFGPYATLPQTVDGVTISMSGTPAAGDSFLISPTRNAAGEIAMAITDPRSIAAAAPFRTSAASTNTGSAQIDTGSVLTSSYLPLPADVTLTYNAGTSSFSVAGAVPAVGTIPYTSGQAISFNGLSFTITGAPADGDQFTLSANTNGVSDSRNALALGNLQSANTMVGGTASYQGAYAQLVSDVGNKANQINVSSTAQDSLLQQVQNAQQSLSGVNLDEEAANLIRYQQAYQASAKVISVADTIFNSLLNLGG